MLKNNQNIDLKGANISVNGGAGGSGGVGGAGGSVNFINISEQFVMGDNKLANNLRAFQKGIDELGLSFDDKNIVNGDLNIAIKEAEQTSPSPSIIKSRFISAIKTINGAGKLIKNGTVLWVTKSKICILLTTLIQNQVQT